MTADGLPGYLPILDTAWQRILHSRPRGERMGTGFGVIDVEIELAEALRDHLSSGESRATIACLFLYDRLAHLDRALVPDRDDILSTSPISVDVRHVDTPTLLWFVERQTEGVSPLADMGGLSGGPPTVESFGLYELRVCAMRCLNHLLSFEHGREAVRRSSVRDRVLQVAIGWCEHAFYSREREYARAFKTFSDSMR